MDKEAVRTVLRELQGELKDPFDLDSASRDLLMELHDDIENLLELSSEATQVQHREVHTGVRASIHRFEQDHPRLTQALSHILDLLAGSGI